MAEKDAVASIHKDFEFLKDKVLAVLIFGSAVDGDECRDIDVCIVAPEGYDIREVFKRIDVSGKRYDVWLFEELPLYMKLEVIEKHVVVFSRDLLELYEYFYKFRKLWKDQVKRNKVTREDLEYMLHL